MNVSAVIDGGVNGLMLGVAVLVVVYLLKRARMTVTGDQARLANIAFSTLFSGLASDPTSLEAQITATITLLVSALLHEFYEWVGKRFPVKE